MKLSLGLGRDNTRIFWGMICNEAGFGVYMTLWPIYIAALGASPEQIGLVLGLQGLTRLVFLLPSGPLGDRVHPERLAAGGRAFAVVGLVLIGVAQRWWQLLPGIVVLSAATVAFPSISNLIAERAGNGWARTRAFTLIYTVGPSGSYLVMPILGGIIAGVISLHAIFYLSALLTAGAVTVFATVSRRPLVVHEGPPVTYRETLAQRPILIVFLLQFATIFVLSVGVTLLPNFLQDVHGVGVEQLGWLGSLAAIGTALIGVVISRTRPFRRPLAGIALSTGAVVGTLGLLLVASGLPVYALAYLLRGGYGASWNGFYSALGEVTPDRLRGRVYALAEIVAGVAVTLAPFAAGWLYALRPTGPMIVGLVLVVPLFAAMAWAERALRPLAPALTRERA